VWAPAQTRAPLAYRLRPLERAHISPSEAALLAGVTTLLQPKRGIGRQVDEDRYRGVTPGPDPR